MSSDHAGGVDEVSLRWTRHAKVEVGAGRHRAGRVAMVHLRLEVKPGGVRVLDVERPRPNPIRAAAAETGARLPVEMRVRHLAVVLVGVVLAGLALWTFGLGASGKGPTLINPEDGTINVAVTQAGSGTWVPYLITVRNLGTQPFTGEVLLVNRPGLLPSAASVIQAGSLPSEPSWAPAAPSAPRADLTSGRSRGPCRPSWSRARRAARPPWLDWDRWASWPVSPQTRSGRSPPARSSPGLEWS